jgi:hypothetical protein
MPIILTLTVGAKQPSEAFVALESEANKIGLKINESKIKYIIAAGEERTIRDVGQSVAIGDKTFEAIKEFVCLGSLVTPNNDVSLRQQLHLSRPTKFFIYKTLIRPVLLYGSVTWVLAKREENQLLVFERKVVQTICAP